jgi:hypothetical protein
MSRGSENAYVLHAGHCTRCNASFADGAPLFMVHEAVIWTVLGADEVALWQRQLAPVCEPCLAPHDGPFPRERRCDGCGIHYEGAGPLDEPDVLKPVRQSRALSARATTSVQGRRRLLERSRLLLLSRADVRG